MLNGNDDPVLDVKPLLGLIAVDEGRVLLGHILVEVRLNTDVAGQEDEETGSDRQSREHNRPGGQSVSDNHAGYSPLL